MTTTLFDESLNRYAIKMSSDELPVLKALERETYRKEMQPVMLSGHLQGSLLQMFSKLMNPKRVLEIGTFTGYSAICLAQGLAEGGLVHTIEIDEERQDIIEKYLQAADCQNKVVTHFGDATEILKGLEEDWDLVFIDADKPNYGHYFDLVIDRLKIGGIIVADNVLFEGKVLLPEEQQGKNEKAMFRFNQKIKKENRVEVLILPIRDGISVIRKVSN
ncbi:MAG: O-methyltransferase [Chitinophagaceae bacterium]|jgi:predicted O-methyltransferase YrrM